MSRFLHTIFLPTIACSVLCCISLAGIVRSEGVAHADVEKTTGIKPEVTALLKQSTEAYKKMKSYEVAIQHLQEPATFPAIEFVSSVAITISVG